MSKNIGKVKPVEITEEMQKSYLDYAMSVIVARALPDIRDGLKPVHRRILFAMQGMGLTHSAKHTKSAKIVGECFVKDTLVLTKKGLIPIQRIKIGDQVYTQNGLKRVSQLYEMPSKPLLKIILNNGISNIVTPSQKFKVLTQDWKFKWKSAKKLTKKDYLVVRATYPEINQLVQLAKIEKNQPKYLNENIAYLLGLYLADGWVSEDYSKKKLPRVSLTAGNSKEIAKKIVSIFEKEFKYRPTIETINYPSSKCYNIRVNRKAINEFIVSNFSLRGKKAPTKTIPQQIFRSPKKVIFSFISGLIDGDGHVAAERKRVHYVSVSKTLIDQLLILLQHQGIFASKYVQKPSQKYKIKGKYLAYSLEVYGQDATKLISQLKLIEVRKNKRLANKRNYSKKRKKEWGNSDIIPYAGRILFQELSHAHLGGGWYQNPNGHKFRKGIKYPGGCKIRYSSNLQEKALRKSQIIGWGIKDKLEKMNSKSSGFLNDIMKKQIHFSKVASVKKVASQKTYDIQVKDDHEFIANGIVSHNCMGKYHPHGDQAIYDALVRLAQDFSMRYPLIDGQGNFGSVDGDPAAAMRYSEARMSKISSEMLADINKDTVDLTDNFDGSLQEPVFLPAKIPNLLLMGADGIAVGMATKIPPHNLNEVIDGLLLLIDKGGVVSPEAKTKKGFEIKKIQLDETVDLEKTEKIPALQASFESQATVEEIIKYINGPDFPTGALIYDQDQILQAYTTGKGKILMRAEAEIEEVRGGRYRIVISQIPYQVNKAHLVAKIAQLIKERKIKGVGNLRDESDRQGMRIVVELKKTAKPKVVLNSLYKHTPMQTTYPANMVALIDGVPQTLTLKQILTEFVKHRQLVITRKSIFEFKTAKNRAHVLEGLKIALDHLDAVITTIKKSRTVETARTNLIKKFKLTEIQANAILEMQLRRLAALERKKIEDEYKEIGKLIEYLADVLTHPEKILQIIKKELRAVKKEYGDSRRTKIYRRQMESFSEEDLIAKEKCLITVTKTGYIKRLPVGTYHSQRRGGKGVKGMTTKEVDEIAQFMTGETHDQVLFFTNKGRVFSIRAWEIPEGSRTSKGQAVINLINIEQGEEVHSVLNLPSGSAKSKYKYLIMATRKGTVKKTSLRNFKKIRSSGLIAIKLNRGDELCWVEPTTGKDQVLLITHDGKSIRFNETDTRPMGRDTIGVRGILLKGNDYVVAMEVFPAKPPRPKDRRRKYFRHVLVVMEKGLGKRTDIRYHPIQKRGGIGVKAANVTKKTGKIIVCRLVTQKDKQVILTSKKGQVIKLPLKNIPRLGRDTQGVILMRFSKPDDAVAALTCLRK